MDEHEYLTLRLRPLCAWLGAVAGVITAADTVRMVVAYRARQVQLRWDEALSTAALDWSLLAALALGAVLLARRFDLRPARRARDLVVHVFATPVFGIAHITLFATCTFLLRGEGEWSAALLTASIVKLPVSAAMYGCTVLGVGVAAAQQRAAREAERRSRLAAELNVARLATIRSRLHPHFLFNALNGIAGLVATDPELAEELIARLGALLRRSLGVSDDPTSDRSDLATLQEELAMLDDYLAIERARLGDRLRVDLDVDAAAVQANVPPLLLQPVVENAVLHGVARRPEGGTVRVRIRRDGHGPQECVQVTVEDDGPGPGDEARGCGGGERGYGLAATRERLRLHFGEAAQLDVGERDRGGTVVQLVVPMSRWAG